MDLKQEEKPQRFLLFQILIIGLIFAAAQIFGYLEAEMFNTYLEHVLNKEDLYIGIMVILSAIVGLIMNLTFGILSDNTRTKFGRRKPFLLFGGIIAGISMIIFGFSPNYLVAVILDVIAIGVASNAYYIAQRSYIPDLVHINYRGRANSIANILGNLGLVISVALFLVLNEFFGVEVAGETVITQQGYLLALSIGGIGIIVVSLIGFFSIKEKTGSELPPKKGFFEEFKEIFNLDELKKNKEFFKIVIAYTVFNSGVFGTMTFLFNYIFDLGFETINLIIIIGIAAPIVFLVIYLLGRISDRYGRKKSIPITVICASVGFFLIPFLEMTAEPVFLLYVLAFTLILVAILGIIPVFDAFYQDYLPMDKKGKFIGIVNIVFTISQVIGTGVATIVSTFLGRPWIFPFMAFFFIASIPLFMKVKETISRKDQEEKTED